MNHDPTLPDVYDPIDMLLAKLTLRSPYPRDPPAWDRVKVRRKTLQPYKTQCAPALSTHLPVGSICGWGKASLMILAMMAVRLPFFRMEW